MTARLTLCTLILLFGLNQSLRAQEPEGSGIITGRVTLDGKPAAGVLLILSRIRLNEQASIKNMMQGSSVTKAVTDSEGRYQFTKLVEATYAVSTFAPSLTTDQQSRTDSIPLTDGETVDGIDFDLKSGSVITGVVTSSDGRPLIGLTVSAVPDNSPGDQSKNFARFGSARTDDRGVYRIFGLTPGRYRVESGMRGSSLMATGSPGVVPGTYHDRTDPSKPGVVNLTAGTEATGIDIKIAPPSTAFEATGRIVDETGRAIPDISVICKGDGGEGTSPLTPFGPQTNSMGEFKIRGLKSGSYTVAPFMLFVAENEYYGESVKFEVKGANVSGLEIKVHKGMTVSGQVVLEGTDDSAALAKLHGIQVMAGTDGGSTEGFSISKSSIGPDGEFVLHGIAPGKLQLILGDLFGQSPFQVARAELNGLPQKDAIQIEPGQNLTGLKIVVLYANCSLHGQVTFSGGKLAKGTSITVSVTRIASDSSGPGGLVETGRGAGGGSTYADPSGNFKVDGLAPGDYQVVVQTQNIQSVDGSHTLSNKPKSTSQNVTLVNGQDAELNVTIDLASNPADK